MHKKNIIIIGSGLGGLSCGVILAKNGYGVTVLEQGNQIGGCLQCFIRRGAKFETGMHFIGSADHGQTLDKLLHYLEISGDIHLSRLNPEGYDIVSLENNLFRFANGREAFIEKLASDFPMQKDNIVNYYNLVENVSGASSLHSLKYAESDAAINTKYQLCPINEVIDKIITDPLLRNVLVGTLPLYAAEKDKTPFSTHAFIMDFYNQSAFRIIGGSDIVASSMEKTIRKYGGDVLTRKKVTKIICNDRRATGVEVNSGEYIPADIIISDTHPMRTLEMLETKLIRPAFRKRINSIPQTVGGFSVYLHFKENAIPYMNCNFYGYNCDSPWGCEFYDENSWPKGYLYMHLCHEHAPEYAKTGVILSYMQMDDVRRWIGTRTGHRGGEYEDFKREKAKILIDSLSKHFPNIRNGIQHYYTSTPLSYFDYTGTEGGSMYGIAKDVSKGVACRVPHLTKVPNVMQTGQNINSHGMLGVLVGSIVTCSELLTAKTIYEQIAEANG